MKRAVQLLAIVLTFAIARDAAAVPRYTARYRQNCTLCHSNPTGGGMRSLYASQYIVPNELSLHKLTDEQMAKIQPKLSDNVTLGTDLRVASFHATNNQPGRNFFQMQGDLYFSFSIDEKFSANVNVDQVGSTETYGMAWVLPWSGYVKAGKFTPVFGWKFPDHNLFTREELWFDQPSNTDTGVEIGFYPKHAAAWADVLNGELPGASRLDTNNELAYVLGALGQFNVKQVGIGIGGSFWYNNKDVSGGPSNVGRRTAGGPYGYINWEGFSWLWEVDASRILVPGKSVKTKLVTSHEISYAWRPGVDFVVNYNYVDRDLDFATGTKQRIGFGVDVDPVPFVQLQAQFNVYRINGADPAQTPPDYPEKDFVRPEIQVHMFY